MRTSNSVSLKVVESYKHYTGKTSHTRQQKRLIHRHERHKAKQCLQKGIWEFEI